VFQYTWLSSKFSIASVILLVDNSNNVTPNCPDQFGQEMLGRDLVSYSPRLAFCVVFWLRFRLAVLASS
jgi:hypothetical protein